MTKPTESLSHLVDFSERLGVLGSPSSTAELSIDILGSAATRKLVGEFALFRFPQDDMTNDALGQITAVQLKNPWHEDPTMRSLIRQRGRVDAVSERQDTHLAQMEVSAVFQESVEGFEPSILGTVPSTGTSIHVAGDEVLNGLLAEYRDQLFYLGRVYGSTPLLPLWFKHFDSGPTGTGEAYHLGIFGKTGSGKSVLAKMILVAYSRHAEMGMLVLDPQGEFAQDIRTGAVPGEFKLPLKRLLTLGGRPGKTVRVRNLVLDRWELFSEILFESPFFEKLTMPKGDNRRTACSELAEGLQRKHVRLDQVSSASGFTTAIEILNDSTIQQRIYRAADARDRFKNALSLAETDDSFREVWESVAALFDPNRENSTKVDTLLARLFDESLSPRPIIVVDLSRESAEGLYWTDKIAEIVIKRLIDCLTLEAERRYSDGRSLNTLVVIDEAHRLAPRRGEDSSSSVRNTLIDAARTTRKYGLGWLFVSQTLSSIDLEIVNQLRIMFFGFGLSMGQEWQALRELAGGSSSLSLYQNFRDPHSSFSIKNRQYSFMTIGPVSPLSFYGRPLFFNAFSDAESFVAANGFRAVADDRAMRSVAAEDKLITESGPSVH